MTRGWAAAPKPNTAIGVGATAPDVAVWPPPNSDTLHPETP